MTLTFIKTRILLSGLLLFTTANVFAQQGAAQKKPAAPSKKETAAPPKVAATKDANQDGTKAANQAAKPSQPKAEKKPDQAAAYYHFSLAHMYEEMMAM